MKQGGGIMKKGEGGYRIMRNEREGGGHKGNDYLCSELDLDLIIFYNLLNLLCEHFNFTSRELQFQIFQIEIRIHSELINLNYILRV